MKREVFGMCIAAAVFVGCKEPAAVVIEEDEFLEVTSLTQDPDVERTAIDSTALLPSDEDTFAGFLTVNKVTYDFGAGADSFAFSRIFFADRFRPIRRNQRTIGYYGFNLGPILLNDSLMVRIPHVIRLRWLGMDTVAGYEYVKNLSTTYQPNRIYTWRSDSIGAAVSIVSPPDLSVLAPAGGAVLRRDRNLELLWRGEGHISIIISAYDPVLRRTHALFFLRPRVNRGRAVLDTRILRLIPPGRYFIFSFVLANRRVEDIVRPSAGQVLLQASDVHNVLVAFP